ncbi:QRFP-like peptide receptor [Actinia tenebrosa]|uniref:QRFP-like peptide receptor n=1 Tax=Actinia tenebrosa TaxID=6105 RepID=A0A6P8IZ30_ACTTE|nr:QRFP-like peptide receptor [Actinia tenebrosa]XP_031572765.1 QRFP-like peptide receptor [Actinia tenebrosa]XP_031572766.1 QRFP-like peptide receptor [Actinia tenebrosa]XP_031572767.1 QRFP-like peptide receptor [Actinia tenebrosa]
MADLNKTSNITSTIKPLDRLNICMEYLNVREETNTEISLKITAYSLALGLAMIGNILVIVIVLRKTHFKTTTNLFIVNMAFSDVMMALICMTISIYSIAVKNMGQSTFQGILGLLICKLLPFLQGISVAVSILTLSTLAADRFLAIVYPFQNFISKFRAKILIVLIWMVAALFNAPLIYAMKFYKEGGVMVCYEIWEPYFDEERASKNYTIVLFVFLYAIPLILVTFFYTALIRELWRGKSLHSNKTRAFAENKSVVKMVMTIIIAFAVCWLPIHVNNFIVLFSSDEMIKYCGLKHSIIFIGWFMGHVNTSINPIIYFTYNEKFRKELKNMYRAVREIFAGKKRTTSATTALSIVKPRIIVTQFNAQNDVVTLEPKVGDFGEANSGFEVST